MRYFSLSYIHGAPDGLEFPVDHPRTLRPDLAKRLNELRMARLNELRMAQPSRTLPLIPAIGQVAGPIAQVAVSNAPRPHIQAIEQVAVPNASRHVASLKAPRLCIPAIGQDVRPVAKVSYFGIGGKKVAESNAPRL